MQVTDRNYIDPLYAPYFFDKEVKKSLTKGYPCNDFRRNQYYGTLTFRSKHSVVDGATNQTVPVCPLGWKPSPNKAERERNICVVRNETKGAFYTKESEISKIPLKNPFGKMPYNDFSYTENLLLGDEGKGRINYLGKQYGF